MMKEQFLLGKLAEECTELAKIALKTQQLGPGFKNPKTNDRNIDELRIEFNHIVAQIKMLNDEFEYNVHIHNKICDGKIIRVKEWMEIAREQGYLEE